MKKLISGVIAVALSLTYVTVLPILPSAQAQTRKSQAQELLQKLLQQAVKQTQAGQLQDSLNTLQKALVLARKLKDTKTESEILQAIALTKNVLAAGGGTTPTAPPPKTATASTSSLIERGLEQTNQGEPNKAIATFEQALTIARQNQDKQTEANALLGIGLNYSNVGQPKKALDAYNQALPIFKATKNRGGEATALTNIGEIYRATGQPQKALEVLNAALPIFKEIRSRKQEGGALNSIGAVYDSMGQPQKAIEFYNQALLITREVNDSRQEATILNNIGEVYKATGQPQKALEYYNGALVASRQIGYASQEATTLNNIAGVYLATGQPQQALDSLNAALPILQKIGDRPKIAATLNNLGEVYREMGQTQKALEYYNQALPIVKEVGARSGIGITLNNIAGTYLITGQTQKALEYYNQALPIVKATGNRTQEATTINNIGQVYTTIGQPQKALEYYNQALPIVKAAGDSRQEGTILNNIGGIYNNIGQLQKALDFYNQALPLFQKVGDVAQESSTLNNIGVAYNALGQPEKALTYYNQALPILQKAGDRPVTATTLNNIGEVYRNLKQPQKALEFYNQALPIYREVSDVGGEAVALNNIGLVYYQSKQQEQALSFYNQALPIFQKVGDTGAQASVLGNIGTLYRDTNRPVEAIAALEKSVEITLKTRSGLEKANRQKFLANSNGRAIGLISLLIDQNQPERAYQWVNLTTTADLADYSRLLGAKVANPEAQKAIEQWNQSNRQLEGLRQQLQKKFSVELSSQVDALQTQINQQAETIASRFPEVAELFETKPADVAALRANIPAGTVIIQPVLLTGVSNVPDAIALFVVTRDKVTVTKQLLEKEQIPPTRKQLGEAENQLKTFLTNQNCLNPNQQVGTSNASLSSVKRQRQILSAQFQDGEACNQVLLLQVSVIPQSDPTYSRLSKSPRFQTLLAELQKVDSLLATARATFTSEHPSVQQLIEQRQVLQEQLKIEAKRVAGAEVAQQDTPNSNSQLDAKTFDALVTQYRQELTDVRFPKRFRATSTKLYDILIRPVEAQIANAKQLSIIATGKLRYIPFETLIDSKTGKYLIEKYPINNLTRLSSRSLQQQPNSKLTMLALGNPSPKDGRNLAGAEAEIKSITPLLPSQSYLGKQASLSNFRTQAPRFSILHLATHGCFQSEGCADLKMPANTLLFSDRNLNIADAALLGLKNTDLVVLSACQTALQASSNGEEFAGIAYLFERAGARSAIASLWLAKDEETKQLMIEFYKNLKQGKTKGEALRQAKLSLITKPPLYWSPFILIGDAR